MTVAHGEAVYSLGDPPCTGLGLTWSGEELDAALDSRVAAVLFDEEGKADIAEILRGVADTAFEQGGLRRVLAVRCQAVRPQHHGHAWSLSSCEERLASFHFFKILILQGST